MQAGDLTSFTQTMTSHARFIVSVFQVVGFASLVCYGSSISRFQQASQRDFPSTLIKQHLLIIMGTVDAALNDYIQAEMNCTTVAACRTQTTNLRISTLARCSDFPGNPFDWNEGFSRNLNGLQDFNYLLQNIFRENVALNNPTVEIKLRAVSGLLSQLMVAIETDLKDRFCLELTIIPLSTYPPCEVCKLHQLPSVPLNIIRNYQFLMQLYEYINNFLNFYNTFLIVTEAPENC